MHAQDLKPERKIRKSLTRIIFTISFVFIFCGYMGTPGTNSFFSNEDTLSGNSVSTGVWIPEISMQAEPEDPDGENGCYETAPCVTLSSTLNADIFYSLGDGYSRYEGNCVEIPHGEWDFSAYSVDTINENWKSDTVSEHFKVCTEAEVGDVVINEVMWMGSTESSSDEWIELRNMTDREIDIGQWKIENARSSSNDLMIPASKKIQAHGFFLISNYPKTSANSALDVDVDEVNASLSLANSDNGNLVLKNRDGKTIDKAKGDEWPAGINEDGINRSMERNDDPGDGLSSSSWHTCLDDDCNDTDYWDDEGDDYGTPGHPNLSSSDEDEDENSETPQPEKFSTIPTGEEKLIEEENNSDPASTEEVVVPPLPCEDELKKEETENDNSESDAEKEAGDTDEATVSEPDKAIGTNPEPTETNEEKPAEDDNDEADESEDKESGGNEEEIAEVISDP
ncbi:MAG TPA: hypothetical protein DCX32_03360 [Candidatus Moranbacteria bacterium]|nr:MAG: Polymorphic membrane protein [Candidatus Moranbacteria bacterium GW2011_GWC2_45_10]KKT94546.1 MAG: Polymorphic membrane protein [Parcubacteria group bacterium GW2011_GWC1_45_14]HAV11557.1 hypothetical protein [Candidatus Moranbacteria bacterium]